MAVFIGKWVPWRKTNRVKPLEVEEAPFEIVFGPIPKDMAERLRKKGIRVAPLDR